MSIPVWCFQQRQHGSTHYPVEFRSLVSLLVVLAGAELAEVFRCLWDYIFEQLKGYTAEWFTCFRSVHGMQSSMDVKYHDMLKDRGGEGDMSLARPRKMLSSILTSKCDVKEDPGYQAID